MRNSEEIYLHHIYKAKIQVLCINLKKKNMKQYINLMKKNMKQNLKYNYQKSKQYSQIRSKNNTIRKTTPN